MASAKWLQVAICFLRGTRAEMTSELPWQQWLAEQLPLLGHRNWIVVADSAYPWQTALGVKTVCTATDHLDVVKAVLQSISRANHVRPLVYTDAELPFLSEADAPGIDLYRQELQIALRKQSLQSLPHDQIIAKLDAAGRSFSILLFKTTLTLPYTSVFMELGCGYWSDEAEDRLRKAIAAKSA
jgi:hypothetical protein